MSLLDNPQVRAALKVIDDRMDSWTVRDTQRPETQQRIEQADAVASLVAAIEAAVREEYDGTTGAMPCPECAAGLCIEVNGKESKLHFAYNSPVLEAVKNWQEARKAVWAPTSMPCGSQRHRAEDEGVAIHSTNHSCRRAVHRRGAAGGERREAGAIELAVRRRGQVD